MVQHSATQSQTRRTTLFSPILLILLLVLYGAGIMALPLYFFGLQTGLWLSAALFAGAVSVVVVLSGANRTQEPERKIALQPRTVRVSPSPVQSWVRPSITPYQQ